MAEWQADDPVIRAWAMALQDAYSLARGERLHQLRGRYVKRFDDRGLHPFSAAWGSVLTLQSIEPELRFAEADPILLRKAAHQEAEDLFITEIQEKRDAARESFESRRRPSDRRGT